ncbi:MAG: ATP-grasp domain-containing protein [Sphingomonas sp.]|jgi:predicted ATP-grasp superfamily ATP-dependent carboligase|uniref:ATP-grasp domain-containing protein n=1 Tax=Sphingomonas sp. TaxID=28214 RepID=UPI0035661293
MNILVSTGEWNAALGCVESLGRLGHAVDVLVDTGFVPAAHSRWCRRAIRTPNEYRSPDYEEALLKVLAGRGYDLFIPISERAMDIAIKLREDIARHTAMVLASDQSVGIAQDKVATQRLAARLGVPTPRSLFPQTVDEFAAAARELGLPAVVKLPRSTGSLGVCIARSVDEVVDYVRRVGRPANWPFIQAYEPGDTADVAAVCRHGELVATHAFYCEPQHMIGGTPPFVRSISQPEEVLCYAGLLARALDWHGPLDFDFTRTADGRYLLLELNARFSGTITFGLAAGLDLPAALVEVAQGRLPPKITSPEGDQRFRTGLEYEFQWWAQRPLARLPEWIATRFDPRVLRISRKSQPGVLLAQLVTATRTLYKRRKKRIALRSQ